jgi:hypothetical protein
MFEPSPKKHKEYLCKKCGHERDQHELEYYRIISGKVKFLGSGQSDRAVGEKAKRAPQLLPSRYQNDDDAGNPASAAKKARNSRGAYFPPDRAEIIEVGDDESATSRSRSNRGANNKIQAAIGGAGASSAAQGHAVVAPSGRVKQTVSAPTATAARAHEMRSTVSPTLVS